MEGGGCRKRRRLVPMAHERPTEAPDEPEVLPDEAALAELEVLNDLAETYFIFYNL